MSFKGAAAITGIGESTFSRDSQKSVFTLAGEAVNAALADAGLTRKDIDGLLTVQEIAEGGSLNVAMAHYLGINPTYSDEVTVWGASNGYAVKQAAEAIAAGTAKNVLIVGADLNLLSSDSIAAGKMQKSGFGMPMGEFESPLGPHAANTSYAMLATLHEHLYGTTEEMRAKVSVDQRFNASKNPNSLFGSRPLSIEDVLNSPIVVSPLHIFEIVYPCDGAMAMIVSRADDAKAITKTPVYVEGAGFYADHLTMASAPAFRNGLVSPVKVSAEQAFKMAGITPKDVDVLGIYDCYTIVVIMTLEDMGFCKKGEGGHFVQEHDLTFKGDLPVNTSGGQLSVGQPGDAGGMVNVIEVVRQLMGKAGERQIPDAEIGVTNSNGGLCMDTECTLVLRRG